MRFLLLLACLGCDADEPSLPAPAGVAPPAPAGVADAGGCLDGAQVSAPWRLARMEDLVPAVLDAVTPSGGAAPRFCPALQLDLDDDGRPDQALLEVHPTDRRSRLRFVLAGGTELVAQEWPGLPPGAGGLVASFVQLKPAGEPMEREYLVEEARRVLGGRDAVEVCAPARTDPGGGPEPLTADNLCACSRFVVVDGARVRDWLVCD